MVERITGPMSAQRNTSFLFLDTSQATTSGTEKTFSGVPRGTKQVVIMFNGPKNSTGADLLVQIGDAGGIEVSGYFAASAIVENSGTTLVSSNTGFPLNVSSSADFVAGRMVLNLVDPSTDFWVQSHTAILSNTKTVSGGGDKALTAPLTQIKISISSGTFNAGAINIQYQ